MIHVPVSTRYFYRSEDDVVHTVIEGSSPFIKADRQFLRDEFPPSKDGLVVINGEMFRVIQDCIISSQVAMDASLLMKESVIAQLLRAWHRFMTWAGKKALRIERPLLMKFGVKEGDVLPRWSITRLLYATWLEVKYA